MPNFTATSRVPTRPLSYENVGMAVPRELIVDYTSGNVYVCSESGRILDITTQVIERVTAAIEADPSSIINAIKVHITDPDTGVTTEVTIDGAVANLMQRIVTTNTRIDGVETSITNLGIKDAALEKSISDLSISVTDRFTTVTGSITNINSDITDINSSIKDIDKTITEIVDPTTGGVAVKATDIVLDDTHQFVTNTQITDINTIQDRVKIEYATFVLESGVWTGSSDGSDTPVPPYMYTISDSRFTADMKPPTMDLVTSLIYDTAIKEEAGYQIYKGVTANGSCTLYNHTLPEVNLTVQVEFKTTGL